MSDMRADLGVKNKFFDAKKQEPTKWVSIDKPAVYILAALLAVAFFVAVSEQGSYIEGVFFAANEKLLEVGYQGLWKSTLEAIPVQSMVLKLLILACGVVCMVVLLYLGCTWADQQIEEMDVDAITPTADETKSYTQRVHSEEYELQKMEYTRKQLEKLTASEEFKRHQSKKKNAKRRDRASQSLLNIDPADISDDDLPGDLDAQS